ncbi:hypothetical protein LTR56_015745 [Elasticomyces elasticus]|nr:hypothetical protein LTR56_015745 [Elasticomyces elasticus]KAK3661956.1 hypothetical protein LTR22_007127 [Elasticomyces elasticus]KAK4933123.1 hypothetical protein LTR49_000607 [Elasticomyces elasticus]KAK5755866.1 hypothetical protein LTS12_013983 [Elasticomyces elasticus]
MAKSDRLKQHQEGTKDESNELALFKDSVLDASASMASTNDIAQVLALFKLQVSFQYADNQVAEGKQ